MTDFFYCGACGRQTSKPEHKKARRCADCLLREDSARKEWAEKLKTWEQRGAVSKD